MQIIIDYLCHAANTICGFYQQPFLKEWDDMLNAAELLFSDGGYTMNIAQLARMKDEKLVDSYTTA